MPDPLVVLPPIAPGLEGLDILTFARDPRLMNFQPWPAQEVILRALYALPMPPELLPLWHQMTESPLPYVPRRYSDVYLILGRQSGKNCMTTVVAGYECICRDYASLLPGHRFAQCVVVATRLEQVRDEFISRLALDLQGSEALAPCLVQYDNKPEPGRRTSNKDQLVFISRSLIRGMPCSAKAVRGGTGFLAIFDEACHFSRELGSVRGDMEVYRAVRPSMRIFRKANLAREISITTPQAKEGVVYEAYALRDERREWQLTMRVPTWVMDPEWSWPAMKTEQEKDPLGFAIEYGAEFAEQISGAFTREEVDGVFDRERPESLPPVPGRAYFGAIDPAFTSDRFGIGVAHRGTGSATEGGACPPGSVSVIADHLEALAPPKGGAVQLEKVLERMKFLQARYGVRRWQTDQYAGEPIAQAARSAGLYVEVQPWGAGYKRTIYSTFFSLVKQRQFRAAWSAVLDRELIRLQVRQSPGGASVGHPAGAGETDDLADVCAVLSHVCTSQPSAPRRSWEVRPL